MSIMKMTGENSMTHISLTNKCLELCQELANQGKAFKFSIMLGTSFSFLLDTRSKENPQEGMEKKKPSPFSFRRNQKRKQDFLETRKTTPEPKPTHKEAKHQCELCDFEMDTKRQLENHERRKHKDKDQLCGSTLPLLRPADGINERYHACNTCGKEFGSNIFLKFHKEIDHDETENFVFSESLLDEWDPEVAGGNH